MYRISSSKNKLITRLNMHTGEIETKPEINWMYEFACQYDCVENASKFHDFNYIQMTTKDVLYNYTDDAGNVHHILRPYLFYDEDYRIVDPRSWEPDIIRMLKNGEFNRLCKENRKNYMRLTYMESSYPEFRDGPVPGTSRPWYRRSSRCSPHIFNELRKNTSPEYKGLVRSKRGSAALKSIRYYHEKYNHSRSWKDCSKCHRQWGKKKHLREKGQYCIGLKDQTIAQDV